ncbi:predicted protein [Nematostella vectensis]|uniref:SUI1 domain-containing protein n=1 Tax=Nematostella vectensis TaxID=45351 RepID=A7RTA8_NEMVE|nr:predicted protein [Nematostella vectensis]|eukprot:XP_001637499.1 predicted protein [Nematostella vectensis]
MPKRNKRKEEAFRDDHEGRPAGLTLGSFLDFPVLGNSRSETTRTDEPLESIPSALPATEAAEIPAKEIPTTCGEFFVSKTKKGKLPLVVENRAKGKKVTVVSNVIGDPRTLLTELKRTGSGGVVRDNAVELQGDHVAFANTRRPKDLNNYIVGLVVENTK